MRRLLDPGDPSLNTDERASKVLSELERDELVDFWQRRADGEWTTRAALMHVHADLVALGAPSTLHSVLATAIEDEAKHTTWCMNKARALGGPSQRAPRLLGDRPLTLSGLSAMENRFIRPIFAGCISETIALHILKQSHADIAPGAVRRANRQHMSEEVNHARLGWAFLQWVTEQPAHASQLRRCLQAALPELLALSSAAWSGGGRTISAALRAQGMISTDHIERGLRLALDEVIQPGFAHFDIHVH